MKYSLSFCLQILTLLGCGHLFASTRVVLSTQTNDGTVGQGCQWYTDEFGPTQSNYSMGDFVRYTVTPGNVKPAAAKPGFKGKGLNLYYGMADIAYAQDVYQTLNNQLNLYNFIGNLFAGYAALNINPDGFSKNNLDHWLTYRQSAGGSLQFDNNTYHQYTIQLVDYGPSHGQNTFPYNIYGKALGNVHSIDQGKGFLAIRTRKYGTSEFLDYGKDPLDNASCAWCSNAKDGNFVLAVEVTPNDLNYAAPCGQFFGARLSHILGAVVNDIPTEKNNTVVVNMPTGTPMPQMAIMNGGPYTQTTSPVGITTPSTAHFGSMKNFLTQLSTVGINLPELHYLKNHLLLAVTRLATVCSYGISNSASQYNMIEINSDAVTAYDNGVIVNIQNNTDDALIVYQNSITDSSQIGTLTSKSNDFFIHTASLMDSSATLTAGAVSAKPNIDNMIEIEDKAAQSSVFIQVLDEKQLSKLVTTLNTTLNAVAGSSGNYFAYNQTNTYSAPNNAQYLLVTNFDTATLASTTVSINDILMYRIQAINIAEFDQKPYCMTLQINKENVGAGLQNDKMNTGTAGTSILYPSIVSMKTYTFQNLFQKQNHSSDFSAMPLLLIPDDILYSSSISGLQAHYGIWLMSYAAALTEFQFGCEFGNNHDCLTNTFDLFDTKNIPMRAVIDAQGNLVSGQSVSFYSNNQGMLIGSDVWDIGNNFHQDIPILNLYAGTQTDINGNIMPVLNQTGGDYINFAVSFDGQRSNFDTQFGKDYGQPYANMMLFSLLTKNMQVGVVGTLSQPTAGDYQIIFTDKSDNVLAVQKVFLNQSTAKSISVNFLNSDDVNWTSSVTLPLVGVGKSKSFVLNYALSGTKHILSIIKQSKKSTKKIVVADHVSSNKIASAKNTRLSEQIEKLQEHILKLNKKLNQAKKDNNIIKEDELQKKLTEDKKKLSQLQKKLKAAMAVKK